MFFLFIFLAKLSFFLLFVHKNLHQICLVKLWQVNPGYSLAFLLITFSLLPIQRKKGRKKNY